MVEDFLKITFTSFFVVSDWAGYDQKIKTKCSLFVLFTDTKLIPNTVRNTHSTFFQTKSFLNSIGRYLIDIHL